MDITVAVGIASILIGVVGWLLANKDAKQASEIDLLFKKHDADAQALADLKLEIAKEHYLKHELDQRFQQLDTTFRNGFRELGAKFDELSRVLITHISKEG